LTGSLGTPFTLFSPTVSTKFTKGAVEYLFLAGLAVLAGQEYLDRRRRRKPRQDQIAEQETTDEVFEELTHTRDKTA
jgi:uncharacterized membrane protein YebE (DUF533 family)